MGHLQDLHAVWNLRKILLSNIRKESRFQHSILYKSGNPITLCHRFTTRFQTRVSPAQIGPLLAFPVVQLMVLSTRQNYQVEAKSMVSRTKFIFSKAANLIQEATCLMLC